MTLKNKLQIPKFNLVCL